MAEDKAPERLPYSLFVRWYDNLAKRGDVLIYYDVDHDNPIDINELATIEGPTRVWVTYSKAEESDKPPTTHERIVTPPRKGAGEATLSNTSPTQAAIDRAINALNAGWEKLCTAQQGAITAQTAGLTAALDTNAKLARELVQLRATESGADDSTWLKVLDVAKDVLPNLPIIMLGIKEVMKKPELAAKTKEPAPEAEAEAPPAQEAPPMVDTTLEPSEPAVEPA